MTSYGLIDRAPSGTAGFSSRAAGCLRPALRQVARRLRQVPRAIALDKHLIIIDT